MRRTLSTLNAAFFGLLSALLLTAMVCAAVMPSMAAAQNALADLGACMAESDCLGIDPKLPGAGNCTEKYCFTRSSKCQGNTGLCYIRPAKQNLSVAIGGAQIADLPGYIQAVYDFAIGAAAVLAATMMMIGGFQYLTAGGDGGRVSAAKERITGALVGLLLVSSAYLILNTINPNLLNLELPLMPVVQRKIFVGCEAAASCAPCGEEFDIKMGTDASGRAVAPREGDCSVVVPKGQGDVTCVGKGCVSPPGGAGRCDGNAHRCVAATEGKTDECGIAPQEGTASWVCTGCTPNGLTCSGSGPTDACCGGFCSDGKCTSGYDGTECDSGNDCRSGLCATSGFIWDGWCSAGKLAMPCNGDNECRDGNRCAGDSVGDGYCLPGTKYSLCATDADCSGLTCNRETVLLGAGVCMPSGEEPTVSLLGNCPVDAPYLSLGGLCTNGRPGAPCSIALGGADCAATSYSKTGRGQCVKLAVTSGAVTTGAGAGAGAGSFIPGVGTVLGGAGGALAGLATGLSGQSICTSGELGSFCRNDTQCAPDTFCYTGGDLGICVSGLLQSPCTNKCADGFICQNEVCIQR